MGVSVNGGTPKTSILIGFSLINHPFGGTPIFGNTCMFEHTKTNFWIPFKVGPYESFFFFLVFFAPRNDLSIPWITGDIFHHQLAELYNPAYLQLDFWDPPFFYKKTLDVFGHG